MELAAKGVQLVGIQGQEVPDWVVVSTDPAVTTCAQLKGQGITVDAVGGIRYTALASMVKSCGLTIKDINPVPLPGSQPRRPSPGRDRPPLGAGSDVVGR